MAEILEHRILRVNQQDATFLNLFCKTLYMFQTVFPSIIMEPKTAHRASGICQTVAATCC